MEDIETKQAQLIRLKEELETDRKELIAVPERFMEIIKTQIKEKEKTISKLEVEINLLIEANSSYRMQAVLRDFGNTINDFVNHYPFAFPIDKEMFVNSISIDNTGNGLIPFIKGLNDKNMQGYFNKRLVVTLPDGRQIEEQKITDTYIQTILEIGIENVKKLGITYLGTELISASKHLKYQQKKIDENCYILTNLSKEKKREILERIGKKLNIPLTARFMKD